VSTALVDLRSKVAAALAPVADGDPNMYTALVDALDPPCLMLGPIGGRSSGTFCLYEVVGVVTAVAGRLEAGAGLDTLDGLVAYVAGRFHGTEWLVESWPEARVFTVGGINYLATRILYSTLATL
jgi:hypothetical protein